MDELSLDILGSALDRAKATLAADPTEETLAAQAQYLSTVAGMPKGDAELGLQLAWLGAGGNGAFTEAFDSGWLEGHNGQAIGTSRQIDPPPPASEADYGAPSISEENKQTEIAQFSTQLPSTWINQAPAYDWLVEGCFLRNTVGMISGDGGLGKTLIGQQLCTCAALGIPWFGMPTKRMKTLAIFCEDDWDELQRRQESINAHYNIQAADLADMTEYSSMVGMDTILAEFDNYTNECRVLPLLGQVRDKALEIGAQLILFDTLADIFGGNESSRVHARRFVQLLRRIAIDCQGAVVMNAHPSLTGLSTGTGTSGSTAWNNSVRSRLYLTKPKETEEGQDTNERILKTMKNNQAAIGGEIRLIWQNGVFKTTGGSGPLDIVDKLDLDGRLTEKLKELINSGTTMPADSSSPYGFSNVMRSKHGFSRYKQNDLLAAQTRLVNQGKLVLVQIGPPSRRYVYIRTSDTQYPSEKAKDAKP